MSSSGSDKIYFAVQKDRSADQKIRQHFLREWESYPIRFEHCAVSRILTEYAIWVHVLYLTKKYRLKRQGHRQSPLDFADGLVLCDRDDCRRPFVTRKQTAYNYFRKLNTSFAHLRLGITGDSSAYPMATIADTFCPSGIFATSMTLASS